MKYQFAQKKKKSVKKKVTKKKKQVTKKRIVKKSTKKKSVNKKKHKIFKGKGVLNNHISAYIMQYLKSKRIPTHFEEKLNDREQLIKKCEIIPIEFVVRNITAGSIAKKLGIKEGLKLKKPLLEYYYKEDSLDDPMISRDHLITFGWATNSELKKIDKMSLQINKHLRNLFFKKNIILVDFKIEFGRLSSNPKKIVLADEISPDSCRLWDKKTNKKLDKDVFRRNLGSLLSAYEEVASRLGIVH